MLAQTHDITGTWQGTVTFSGRQLQAVIKIAKATDNTLKAVLYACAGDDPISTSVINLDGSTLVHSVLAHTRESAMTGNVLDGIWTSGSQSQPLKLDRANVDTAWTIPATTTVRMPANADPVFDVASIKRSVPGKPGKGFGMKGHEFLTFNTTASDLIKFAYRLNANEIMGGPDGSTRKSTM